MIGCAVATYLFFHFPWIFPILIVLSGAVTNLSRKRIPDRDVQHRKVKWANIWLFAILFLLAGVLSETARKQTWPNRQPINLFENMYRLGSLVFGGGHVLMPMMYEQFSVRPAAVKEKNPNAIQIAKDDMMTGIGMVRAMPGPVFSIGAFTGGMALRSNGPVAQIAGCVIGTVALFLPSVLLVLFFFPVWNNLKKYAVVYRSLEGINAAVVGIMIAATLFIAKDIAMFQWSLTSLMHAIVITVTFLMLQFTRVASPFIVLGCLLLGYLL